MNEKKQKRIINNLLNSPDLMGRCIDIIKPSYFEPELIPHVKFLVSYHLKHNANPTVELMNAECDSEVIYEKYIVTKDEIEFSAEEVETFCRQCEMRDAIFESYDLIKENEFDKIYKLVSDALAVNLKKDLGLDVFTNPEETLKQLMEELEYVSCGITDLDVNFGGGTLVKQFYMVSANSGGGKSVMLSNIANNYALQGKDVVYISLELPPEMIFLRQAFIMSSCSHRIWKSKVFEIATKIKEFKKYGAGNFKIVRMPIGSTANAIRAYLKQYEIEMEKGPDVLCIDYLDLMRPTGGIKGLSVSEQDKQKSEEIYEILNNYELIGWSASQQNRDALKMNSPDQSVVAGGISKMNICDYWVSVYMNSTMRMSGEMLAYFLKTRYSDAQGKSILLGFDDATLKISNHKNPGSAEELIKKISQSKGKQSNNGMEAKFLNKLLEDGELNLPNLESEETKKLSAKAEKAKDLIVDFSHEDDITDNNEDLIKFMNNLQMES